MPLFTLLYFAGGRNGAKKETQASDDDVSSEVLSHYSSTSETASVPEEGMNELYYLVPMFQMVINVVNGVNIA